MRAVAESLPPTEPEQFEQIIHDYLLKHPELVIEALQAAEAKQKQKEQEATHAAITSRRDELLNDPSAPSGGNPKRPMSPSLSSFGLSPPLLQTSRSPRSKPC